MVTTCGQKCKYFSFHFRVFSFIYKKVRNNRMAAKLKKKLKKKIFLARKKEIFLMEVSFSY